MVSLERLVAYVEYVKRTLVDVFVKALALSLVLGLASFAYGSFYYLYMPDQSYQVASHAHKAQQVLFQNFQKRGKTVYLAFFSLSTFFFLKKVIKLADFGTPQTKQNDALLHERLKFQNDLREVLLCLMLDACD